MRRRWANIAPYLVRNGLDAENDPHRDVIVGAVFGEVWYTPAAIGIAILWRHVMSNFVKAANRRIWDFVHEPQNERLLHGTDTPCTPFRGTLFGESDAHSVAKHLETTPVDILWLGSNPNVPESATAIRDGNAPGPRPPHRRFQWQLDSTEYAERRWTDEGDISPDLWDPVNHPEKLEPRQRRHWSLLSQIVNEPSLRSPPTSRAGARLERVAFANVIPWGSSDMPGFWSEIKRLEDPTASLYYPGLRERIWAFADDLNSDLVHAMRPRLIVAPFSIRNSNTGLGLAAAVSSEPHQITTTREITVWTGVVNRRGVRCRMAWLPHLSAKGPYRLAKAVKQVAELLSEQLAMPSP